MTLLQKTSLSFIILFFFLVTFSCKTTKKAVTKSNDAATGIISPTEDTVLPKTTEPAAPKNNKAKTDAFLENLLEQYPLYFNHIIKNKETFKVQIIYTQINRDAANKPEFRDYYFNTDTANYFYPASTVKMPVALLALQRLNELKDSGISRHTAMISESAYSGQTPVYNDPTTPDGSPAAEQYIKKIFLVSDNDAFNRLYEFLGQRYINDQLHQKGYTDAQINHRLNIFLSQDENRHTNPVQFRDETGRIIYNQPMQYNSVPYVERNDLLGKGYYKSGVLINEPMNFSIKNRISLEDLHHILRSILFPASVAPSQRFNIKPEDYRFVWQHMSQLPHETKYPSYDSSYYDAYCKFLLLGGNKKATLPEGVRIFNKTGDAYGFLLDIAYIADFNNQTEFMLSTVIYCNEDDIVNDDTYEFDTIGLPFMKHLGEIIYQYELKRKKKYLPDLSAFKIEYDK